MKNVFIVLGRKGMFFCSWSPKNQRKKHTSKINIVFRKNEKTLNVKITKKKQLFWKLSTFSKRFKRVGEGCTDNTSPDAHTRTFFSLRTSHVTARVPQGMMSLCESSQKIIPTSVMSLLGVPSTPFIPMFSSSSTLHTTPAISPALSTGIRLNSCAAPLGDGLWLIGWPEPKHRLWAQVLHRRWQSEHDADQSSVPKHELFSQEYDATIAASEDLHLPRHSVASSIKQHSAACNVPTLSRPRISGNLLQ